MEHPEANSHVNLLVVFRRVAYNKIKETITMPNIKPISDLRNYTEVLQGSKNESSGISNSEWSGSLCNCGYE